MSKKITAEQIAKMTESASKRVLAAKSPSEITVVSVIELNVDDVLFYEHNPRQLENEKYEEIKASIQVRGLEAALYITKRPGSAQYMLAKGGKTRLRALQELAKEDPKFARVSFQEVPWVSESDIMAAHLVENTTRSDMCFWDVAEGIAKLLDQIIKETGKPASSRNVPKLLKERGLDLGHTVIRAAEFALKYLQNLGPWKRELGVRDVHDVIRADFMSLAEIMEVAPHLTDSTRKEILNHAIAHCVATQPSYSPKVLLQAVTDAVAKALGVTPEQLMHAVAAHQLEPLSDLAKFEQVAASYEAQDRANAQAPATEEAGNSQQGGPDGQNQAQTTTTQQTELYGPEPRSDIPDAVRERLNSLMGKASGRATDMPGIAGVTIAKGLTPRPPKAPNPSKGGESQHDGVHGGPLTQQELDLLEALGPKGIARHALQSALTELGDVVGISHLIVESPSPHLPYGYYMELPERGAINGDKVALDGWWFLAALSAQGEGRILPNLIGPEATDGMAFRSAEPGTFADAILSEAAFKDAIETRLGGQEIPAFELLLRLITRRDHPLYNAAIGVIDACAGYNAHYEPGGQRRSS